MKLPDYPAKPAYGDDGDIHIFDTFGDPWCENIEIVMDSSVGDEQPANPGDWSPWCDGCLDGMREEGLL